MKQHTQIPQDFDWTQLEWCDQLVFAQIKRKMNPKTRTCYPSVAFIKQQTKLSSTFIKDSIQRLESYGLVKITKRQGTSNLYWFPEETDQFEMFSEEFLDMDLPAKIKEYYMKIQNGLFDKDQKIAYTQYTDKQLASLTGLSVPTVKKYNSILQQKGYMTTEITPYRNEAGFNIRELSFDMEKLGQFGLWAKAVTEQVSTNTEDINALKSKIDEYEKRIKSLERMYHANLEKVPEVTFTPVEF